MTKASICVRELGLDGSSESMATRVLDVERWMREGKELALAKSQRLPWGDRTWEGEGGVLGVDHVGSSRWMDRSSSLGPSAGLGAVLVGDSGTAFLPTTLQGPATPTGMQLAPFGRNGTGAWHSGP